MIQKLISSFLAFLLSIGLVTSNRVDTNQNNQTTILFSGDVMLGRSVMSESIKKNDLNYSFQKVSNFTKDSDITVINLENPIIKDCPIQKTGSFKFCTTPEIAKGLEYAGIDVVSLANNHSGNFGVEGLEETKKYLDEMGIEWFDSENIVVLERGGIKFGFLGFDYTISKSELSQDLDQIARFHPAVDVLIIMPHWGEEYTLHANTFQKNTAQKFIENGADLIIGNHPHWVQDSEIIENVPVYYSLGNFVFDQMWSEETKKGKLVRFTFEGNKIINTEEFNTYISKIGQPEIVDNF